jgi:ketosteroid isomerase-like protein
MTFLNKRLVGFVVVLCLGAGLLSACQPVRSEAALANAALSEQEQFTKVAMGLEEAYQAGDLDRTIAYYADDAISQPPGFPTSRGKEAIKADYKAFFDTYNFTRDFKLAGITIDGNTATRLGEWTQVLTPKDGSAPTTEVGRCIVGFKKVDGEWKVAYEIWNTYN